jgi:hypothetical protein
VQSSNTKNDHDLGKYKRVPTIRVIIWNELLLRFIETLKNIKLNRLSSGAPAVLLRHMEVIRTTVDLVKALFSCHIQGQRKGLSLVELETTIYDSFMEQY